jgi:uncharacterized protein (PEP-CTERM system associated)
LQTYQDNERSDNDGPLFNVSLDTRNQRASLHLEGTGGFFLDFFSPENRGSTKFYDTLGLATYQLTQDLLLTASAGYRWEDFLERDRRDEVWIANAGLTYTLRDRLTLSFDAVHIERDSTVPGAEFIDNRVTLRLTLEYPWKIK